MGGAAYGLVVDPTRISARGRGRDVRRGPPGIVTSANIACGGHAGDEETIRRVCPEAARGRGRRRRPCRMPTARLRFRRPVCLPADELTGSRSRPDGSVDRRRAQGRRRGRLYQSRTARFYPPSRSTGEQAEAVARGVRGTQARAAGARPSGSVWLDVAVEHGLRPVASLRRPGVCCRRHARAANGAGGGAPRSDAGRGPSRGDGRRRFGRGDHWRVGAGGGRIGVRARGHPWARWRSPRGCRSGWRRPGSGSRRSPAAEMARVLPYGARAWLVEAADADGRWVSTAPSSPRICLSWSLFRPHGACSSGSRPSGTARGAPGWSGLGCCGGVRFEDRRDNSWCSMTAPTSPRSPA